MKAMILTKYGDPSVLKLDQISKPTPKDNEILIKIINTTVTVGDVMVRRKITLKNFNMPIIFYPITRMLFGVRKPRKKILGSEFSGVIESVGKNVNSFQPGDDVFGYRSDKMGVNADYLAMPVDGLILNKPSKLSFEESASIPYGALTAFSHLKRLNIQPGQKVLINGASGLIGSFAVQIAKYFGAEVTGVCSSTKVDFVKSLGADHVIDYTKEDFTQNYQTYDIIYDILNKTRFSKAKKSLNKGGRLVLVSFGVRQIFQMLRTKIFGNKKVLCVLSSENIEIFREIRDLTEKGYIKPLIDKLYAFENLPEAHLYVEQGLRKGGVVITVN